MSAPLSRAIMALAVHCLGDHRRDWALAMQGELAVAVEDGHALGFAFGCLAAAWRDMPTHPQGRFTLISNGLALGLVVPAAAICLSGALLGFPFLEAGDIGVHGFLAGASRQLLLLNDGDCALAPPLTLLVIALSAGQLLLAWCLLERDWDRVAIAQRFNAAVLTTLVILTALLTLGVARTILPIVGLVTETLAVLALARWHDEIPCGSLEPGG